MTTTTGRCVDQVPSLKTTLKTNRTHKSLSLSASSFHDLMNHDLICESSINHMKACFSYACPCFCIELQVFMLGTDSAWKLSSPVPISSHSFFNISYKHLSSIKSSKPLRASISVSYSAMPLTQ